MSLEFHKAIRSQSKARLAICGPAGAGKTYTALTAAEAFKGDSQIAVIDTERGSSSLYADVFNFNVLELGHFDPLQYVEAIKAAEGDSRFRVLVIDSLSHAWEGEDGALDQVDQNAARYKGNSFAAWRTVTPKHRKLVDTMLQSNLHIIATMRTKMDYVIEQDGQGKSIVRKVGLAPVQRAGIEYEFTWVVDMDLDHNAVVSKSRAEGLADLVVNKPGVTWFSHFYNWLMIGQEPVRTKQELINFGESMGLNVEDVATALHDADLHWSPDLWADMTSAVIQYAKNTHKS